MAVASETPCCGEADRLDHAMPIMARKSPKARSVRAASPGVEALTARLGAELGMLAFTIAVEQWMDADSDEPFARCATAP
jgi:hypothetical protein